MGGRQLATRISFMRCANWARSADVVPATPPAEVRLGAPAVLPPGMPAHAGVVTTGAGDGAAGWTGAGAGPEGFGWTAAPVEPAAEVAPLDGAGAAVAAGALGALGRGDDELVAPA